MRKKVKLKRDLKYLVKMKFFVEQFYGLLAQISTGLPQILILVLLSNKFDVLKAGLFGIFIGYVAVIYSISLWGMRNTYVLGIVQTKKEHYFVMRLLFMAFAGIITYVFGIYKSIDFTLIYFIIFIKSIDSLLDMDFGFNQVIDSLEAQKRMSILNIMKLFGSIFFMTLYYFDVMFNNDNYSLIYFIILTLLYVRYFVNNLNLGFKSFRTKDYFEILKYSAIFMFATASCSLLTNLPRISVEKLYTGDELGIAGVCLSVSTLLAMVFNVNWQKYFSKYKNSQHKNELIRQYVNENILLFSICSILSISILPFCISLVFNFAYLENYLLMIKILGSFLVFSLGMNYLNIYKLTKYKILESIFYCLGFFIFYFFIILTNAKYEIYLPLLITGLFMILSSLLSKIFGYERG